MNNITLKIVLIGDTNVGKTSIVNSYIYNNYNNTTESTIGVMFTSKTIKVKYCKGLNEIHNDDNLNRTTLNVKLHIWDTAGQEKYRALAPMYFRNADILFYVNDVTSKNIRYNIKNDVLELLKDNCLKVIIFNKIDLPNNYNINQYESNSDYIYKAVSAKNRINIDELFELSVHKFLKINLNYLLKKNNNNNNIILEDNLITNNCC